MKRDMKCEQGHSQREQGTEKKEREYGTYRHSDQQRRQLAYGQMTQRDKETEGQYEDCEQAECEQAEKNASTHREQTQRANIARKHSEASAACDRQEAESTNCERESTNSGMESEPNLSQLDAPNN